MRRAMVGALIGTGLLPSWLSAQLPDPQSRTITGLVVDSVSQRPIPAAVLYFDRDRTEYSSGEDGAFRIENVDPRQTILVVRRIGYVPVRVAVPVSGSAAVIDVGRVILRPVATELDRIVIEAEEIRLQPNLAGFYDRKRKGMGTFITREDIERLNPRVTSRMVSQARGVYLDCPPGTTGVLDCTAYSNRGRDVRFNTGAKGSQVPGSPTLGGEPGERVSSGWSFDRCPMEVWIDGHLSTFGIDEIDVMSVAAIEVYAGPGVTPAVLGKGRCGVIAMWTRQGGPRQ